MTKVYTTSNVILTMGEDFHYQDAHTWFKNLDKLI
jgi:lysosomal alpha-mannosidase